MLWETISARRRSLQDVVARQGFCAWLRRRVATADLLGGEHDRFRWRADGCQSGDRLDTGDLPGGVQQHESALVLVVVPRPRRSRRQRPEMPATIRPDEIVGKWGLASFQNPNDRARTEAAASAQCKQPYVIGAGGNGGVIMHLADQATPQELRLKGSPSGKNYIGPPGSGRRRAGSRNRLLRRAGC